MPCGTAKLYNVLRVPLKSDASTAVKHLSDHEYFFSQFMRIDADNCKEARRVMQNDESGQSSLGIAIFAWFCTFVAAWALIAFGTNSHGLGLVWGIFAALFAFEISRRSFRRGMVIIFTALMTVFLVALYSLLR